MLVTKRDGHTEPFNTAKLSAHIRRFCFGLDEAHVDIASIIEDTVAEIYNGITTKDLETLTLQTVASRKSTHPDYNVLAGRLRISRLHSETLKRFSVTMASLPRNAEGAVSEEGHVFVMENADALDSVIIHARDYNFNLDDFEALSAHLLKRNDKVVERPQQMFMRTALCSLERGGGSVENVVEAYDALSRKLSQREAGRLFMEGDWSAVVGREEI